ncbi:cobalt ABC transporter, ATPase subunit [Dethiobacter alkaliphilus AHT 1]|uniref:ABC transporter ATP-binding protein n=1 Tax=Dethiobacter alkaliphilus AHT 1 TaxID=555088 RepID=C0GC55_DETAL|nr:ATP-binding cassette domain-containing protein [Dethiobacter alkaliphilus]EEG78790.1 cobalt ABC transporter, ATPase subunit [Dethiobacter alkaliphilus AHT 1]
MKAVEIRNLNYSYSDGTKALNNLSLSIPRYRRVALLGANGSGKTTLLQHLNGLLLPQDGSVTVMGYYPVDKKHVLKIRQLAGMLFDTPEDQLFSTTVAEDVAFGPRNLELDEQTVNSRVRRAMELAGITDLADKPPYNLSLGQKKRVAIAGVLAMEPELLIFDEPFSGLDPRFAAQLMDLLEKLFHQKCTIIITTHDVDMAYAWADHVIILSKGQVLAEGTAELLQDKDLMTEASLNVPMLATAFSGTDMAPRTPAEANQLLRFAQRKTKVL